MEINKELENIEKLFISPENRELGIIMLTSLLTQEEFEEYFNDVRKRVLSGNNYKALLKTTKVYLEPHKPKYSGKYWVMDSNYYAEKTVFGINILIGIKCHTKRTHLKCYQTSWFTITGWENDGMPAYSYEYVLEYLQFSLKSQLDEIYKTILSYY